MTCETHESGASAKTWTIIVWASMLLGPVAFFLSLLSFGVWLFGMGAGWWGASESPPSDSAIFGPIIAVVIAEAIGAIVAFVRRREFAGSPFETHATSAIQTFWIMFAGFAVSICLAFSLMFVPNIEAAGFGVGALLIVLFTLPLLFIWKTFRVAKGLRRAMEGEPIADDPRRWS
jgi:uncharacterized membrane protein